MSRFKLWKSVVLTPFPTLDAESKNMGPGIMDGFVNNALSAVIVAIVLTIGLSALVMAFSSLFPAGSMSLTTILADRALSFVLVLAGSFILTGMYYVMAHILGGRTSFGHLYYMLSLVSAPVYLASALGFIPCLGVLVELVAGFYGIYLLNLAIQKTYGFDGVKAFIVWLVPVIIFIALIVLVVGVALVGFFPSLMSGAKGY